MHPFQSDCRCDLLKAFAAFVRAVVHGQRAGHAACCGRGWRCFLLADCPLCTSRPLHWLWTWTIGRKCSRRVISGSRWFREHQKLHWKSVLMCQNNQSWPGVTDQKHHPVYKTMIQVSCASSASAQKDHWLRSTCLLRSQIHEMALSEGDNMDEFRILAWPKDGPLMNNQT